LSDGSAIAPRAVRILVAEPSKTLAALIRASLAELAAEVELCADGAQALASARQRVPDVLICDERVGGLDGYALAHAMRQLPGDRRVQTLLMVPEHGHPDPERLAYVGVADVLTKPFERAVLLERVRGLLPQLARPFAPRLDYNHGPGLPAPRVDTPRTEPSPRATLSAYGRPSYEHSPPVLPAPQPWVEPAPPAGSNAGVNTGANIAAIVDGMLAERLADLSQLVDRGVEARLSALVSQRLPAVVEGALSRLLPGLVQQAVDQAVSRAVNERVPMAVAAVVDEARETLGALASPDQVEQLVRSLAQDTVTTALGKEVLTLVPAAIAEVKAHIESELLSRLDRFAKTELPQKLTSHAEQIVWKVVPTIAEDLVREEIKRLTSE
jgi:CheY-like chemotaxis protein